MLQVDIKGKRKPEGVCCFQPTDTQAAGTTLYLQERTNCPALSAEMGLAAQPPWLDPAGKGSGGPPPRAHYRWGKSSSPSDLHFIQITGKVLFKTEPLSLAKTLGLLSPEELPRVSSRSPPCLTSRREPGLLLQLLATGRPSRRAHAYVALGSGEKEEELTERVRPPDRKG